MTAIHLNIHFITFRETFQPLLDSLDPKGSNPLVTVKVFQTALKKWFYDTDENNSESFLNLSDMKQPTNQCNLYLRDACFIPICMCWLTCLIITFS